MSELFRRAQAGDAAAREALVVANLPLVRSIVNRFPRAAGAAEDLFQVGCVGLLKALDRFDPDRGVRFSTYAVPVILGEVRRHLRDDAPVHVQRSLRERGLALRQQAMELAGRLGREPTLAELAGEAGCDVAEVVEALDALQRPVSLSVAALPVAAAEGCALDRLALEQALQSLEPRAREILRRRFVDCQSQAEVARAIGLSQGHVSRLERAALAALRELLAG